MSQINVYNGANKASITYTGSSNVSVDATNLSGLTGNVQTAIDSKVAKVTSTDNAIVRFNGTTGEVQNSGVTIDDSGNLVLPNISLNSPDSHSYITLNGNTDRESTIYFNKSGTNKGVTGFGANSNDYFINVNGSERMRISSSGNLLVKTVVDNGVDALQVNGSISSRARGYGVANLNDLYSVSETVVVSNSTLNIPYNDYGYVTVVTYDGNYAMQQFVGLNGPARLFVRVKAGAGGWSAWSEK